jgi:hypothetical protein
MLILGYPLLRSMDAIEFCLYFLFSPSKVFDPVWCRNSRWIIVIAAVVNGNGKCNA